MQGVLKCGDKLPPLFDNGMGWDSACTVNTFTNVYLGVPPKEDDRYTVRFEVEGAADSTLQVYVNGRVYEATRDGSVYAVEVRIRYGALTSPTVVPRGLEVPPIKLRSIELV
jgi:hypothetical protein